MQGFDTSMTDTQFKIYYRNKNEELMNNDAEYQNALTDISKQIEPVEANMNRIRPNLQQVQYEFDALRRRKSQLENTRNQYQNMVKRANVFTRGLLARIIGPRFNQTNAQITDVANKIQSVQNKLTELSKEMNSYKSALTPILENKTTIINNKNKNDNERIILIKQQFYYGNREEACKELSAVIAKQEQLLKQYNEELTTLNKQHADCKTNYENTCSVAERNVLTTLIAERDEQSKQLDQKYEEYDDDCKDKIQDCDPLFSVFQQKKAVYDDETNKKNKLDDEYKTCMDPKKNKCKDIYNDTNFNKSTTEMNVDMLKPSTSKTSEGFTQYSGNDNADATHAKLVANYKSVQNNYTKLKNNVQELNSANNNDIGKTSRYATHKQLYDNAIYTNILLTALATSIVYYIFTDL
jgi:chromosome segregation ATPase